MIIGDKTLLKDNGETINIGKTAENLLVVWNQTYICDECTNSYKEQSYHLKDTLNKEVFKSWHELDKWLSKKKETYNKQQPLKPNKEPITKNIKDTTKKLAIWGYKKNYTEDEIILKFIETHNGIRCRVVDQKGNNIPNGALFFLKDHIIIYEHVNPDIDITLVQNNRINV